MSCCSSLVNAWSSSGCITIEGTLQYKDQNDLIQNQRALAELVGQINDQFTRIRDEGFAEKFDNDLKKLQADLDKLVLSCLSNNTLQVWRNLHGSTHLNISYLVSNSSV